MTNTWPKNDREWARQALAGHIGCNVTTCPNGKCRATGECIDVPAAVASPPLAPTYYCTPDCREYCVAHDEQRWCASCPENTRKDSDARRLELAPKMRPPLKTTPPADDLVNPKTLMGARRVDLSLLPAAGIIHGAHAMMDGAVKYNPYNWREKKVPARTYVAAAMRHLLDFLDGEETAADSGVHHLGHVIGCCAIVLDAMETGNLIDDRPNKGSAAAILTRLEKVILERNAARLASQPAA